jgi:hypothetical protein
VARGIRILSAGSDGNGADENVGAAGVAAGDAHATTKAMTTSDIRRRRI